MSIDDAFNFRRIDERVTTSGLVTADQLRDLRGQGYDAVINLLPDSYEHAVPDEARIVAESGLDYVYIPVDFAKPTRADLDAFAAALDARAGQTVHIHCAANYRVSAFFALYLLRSGRSSEAEADALVQSVWDPTHYPAWDAFIAEERNRL